MFGKETLKQKIGIDFAMSDAMAKAVELWANMYANRPPWVDRKTSTLGLPSAIASEIARMVTIEMKSEVSGSPRADYLNERYHDVIDSIRTYTEYSCAKGGLVLKPYVSGDTIVVDYIQADCFYPTAFDANGNITGAVFVEQKEKGSYEIYTRLEYHSLEKKVYTIRNTAYRSYSKNDIGQQVSLTQVAEWAEIEPEVTIQNIEKPLFAYFKMPQANNIDTSSPLGVSVYSRAVDLICEADKQYSRLLWEFESGERALYVNENAFLKEKDGKPRLPDTRLYRTLNADDDNLFKDWTPTLREQNILNGLNSILTKIEDVCGLARGTFSEVQSEAKTATELKILRQRSYATIADTQKALQNALEDMVYAMDVLCTLYSLAPAGKYDMSFEFDDSIVTDRAAEFIEKQQLVTMNIMQPWEYRMWYFGETEEQAKAAVGESAEQNTDENRFTIGGGANAVT